MSKSGLVVPTVPMRRRMPSPPPAMGQSCAGRPSRRSRPMRGDKDTGTRGQDGVDLLLRGDPLVARLRAGGLSHKCDRCARCSAQIAASKYSVFLRLRRTNWSQRSAGSQGEGEERHTDHYHVDCALISGAKRQKGALHCKISVFTTLAPASLAPGAAELTRRSVRRRDDFSTHPNIGND